MREFIKDIFANRLGNVLAITNFVLIVLIRNGLTERFGIDSLYMFAFIVNLPARMFSRIFLESFFLPERHLGSFYINYYSLETLFCIYLQWIFVGWTAKTIARRIQPSNI